MTLIVKSKVKESTDHNVSADFLEELNIKVQSLIKDAEHRCNSNGRKTLKSQDL